MSISFKDIELLNNGKLEYFEHKSGAFSHALAVSQA